MRKIAVAIGLVWCAVQIPGSVALAATAPSAAPPPPVTAVAPANSATPGASLIDPGNLAIARQIIAVVMPPDRAEAMMGKVTEAIMRPVQAQMRSLAAQDPRAAERAKASMARLGVMMRDVIIPMLPDMTESMAHGYARLFSRDDLLQILAFAQTPAGSRYFARASDLLQDPDVQAFYGRLIQSMQARQAQILKDIKDETDPAPAH